MVTENVNNHVNEKNYERKLSCSQRVYDTVTKRCIEEYKKHHPDRQASHITQGEILDIISTFYINSY